MLGSGFCAHAARGGRTTRAVAPRSKDLERTFNIAHPPLLEVLRSFENDGIYRAPAGREAPRVRVGTWPMIFRAGTGWPGASHSSKKFQLTSTSSLSGSSRYAARRPSGCVSRTTYVPGGSVARSVLYSPRSRTSWWPWNGRDAFVSDDGVNVTTSVVSGSTSSSTTI